MQEHLSRGKRAKARRAKEKYADQDEEDRELALQVLGSAGRLKECIWDACITHASKHP